MNVSGQTRDQIEVVLARLVGAVRQRDTAALESLADPGLDGFWLGRPVDGPGGLVRVLRGAPFTLSGLAISCEGTVAWASACMLLEGTDATPGFLTAVLRGTGHAWVLAQIHASLPA